MQTADTQTVFSLRGAAMRAYAMPEVAELDELGVSNDGLVEPVSSRVIDAERDEWALFAEWTELVDSYDEEAQP